MAQQQPQQPEASSSGSLKEQGNAEYRGGHFLKAAALFTRAIKEDPGNAVLYR